MPKKPASRKKKRGRGRPPLGALRKVLLTAGVSQQTKKAILRESRQTGQSLSSLAGELLDHVYRRSRKRARRAAKKRPR